jgi:hypothetical protein
MRVSVVVVSALIAGACAFAQADIDWAAVEVQLEALRGATSARDAEASRLLSYRLWRLTNRAARHPDYDCLCFNTDRAAVVFTRGEWKVVDTNQQMFSFGSNEQDAIRALDIIRKYRFDATCFAGRPFPRETGSAKTSQYGLVYLLSAGRGPQGELTEERCSEMDLASLNVSRTEAGWALATNAEVLFTFGRKRLEAELALEIIRHYGFRFRCVVGEEGNFRYLRQ